MLPKNRPPTHPGEVLLEDFLRPRGMSQTALAAELKISRQRINALINGTRGMTPDIAILLARFFETTAEFWLTLHTTHQQRPGALSEKQALALAIEAQRWARKQPRTR